MEKIEERKNSRYKRWEELNEEERKKVKKLKENISAYEPSSVNLREFYEARKDLFEWERGKE